MKRPGRSLKRERRYLRTALSEDFASCSLTSFCSRRFLAGQSFNLAAAAFLFLVAARATIPAFRFLFPLKLCCRRGRALPKLFVELPSRSYWVDAARFRPLRGCRPRPCEAREAADAAAAWLVAVAARLEARLSSAALQIAQFFTHHFFERL